MSSKIDALAEESNQAKKLLKRYQEAIDWINRAEPGTDVFEGRLSFALSIIRVYNPHECKKSLRELCLSRVSHIQDNTMGKVKEAHKATSKDIGLIASQFFGALAGGVIGSIPYFGGLTGSAAGACQAASHAVSSGSSATGGIQTMFQTKRSGEIYAINYEVDTDKNFQHSLNSDEQTQQQLQRAQQDAIAREENTRHEVFQSMANSG